MEEREDGITGLGWGSSEVPSEFVRVGPVKWAVNFLGRQVSFLINPILLPGLEGRAKRYTFLFGKWRQNRQDRT